MANFETYRAHEWDASEFDKGTGRVAASLAGMGEDIFNAFEKRKEDKIKEEQRKKAEYQQQVENQQKASQGVLAQKNYELNKREQDRLDAESKQKLDEINSPYGQELRKLTLERERAEIEYRKKLGDAALERVKGKTIDEKKQALKELGIRGQAALEDTAIDINMNLNKILNDEEAKDFATKFAGMKMDMSQLPEAFASYIGNLKPEQFQQDADIYLDRIENKIKKYNNVDFAFNTAYREKPVKEGFKPLNSNRWLIDKIKAQKLKSQNETKAKQVNELKENTKAILNPKTPRWQDVYKKTNPVGGLLLDFLLGE